jgi:DNA repair exonuclease SbcCD ATPase subunit
MKLQELKAKVYELAGVNTTQKLKAKYGELKGLDMRRKSSWEKAFTVIQGQHSEFKEWLENPPDEYKDLFSEITEASQQYDRKSTKAKRLVNEVLMMAGNLEELAEECQAEARQLERDVNTASQISKQANLN